MDGPVDFKLLLHRCVRCLLCSLFWFYEDRYPPFLSDICQFEESVNLDFDLGQPAHHCGNAHSGHESILIFRFEH